MFVLLACGCSLSFTLDDKCFAGQPCAAPDVAPDAEAVDTEPREDTNPNGDDDDDGALNASDKCPTVWNPSQLNYDGDEFGDECDPCPFVADQAAPCYSEWDDAQTAGDWVGYVSFSKPGERFDPEPRLEMVPIAVTLGAGEYAPTGAPDSRNTLLLGTAGTLFLEDLLDVSIAGTAVDAMLVVDARREVAVGHLTGQGARRGVAAPPSLVVLTRKRRVHGGITPGITLAESRLPPGKPPLRSWRLNGWVDVDGPTALTHNRFAAQGLLDTRVENDMLEVVGYDDADKAAGLVWLFDSTGAPAGGSGSPSLRFDTGGTLSETTDGLTLDVPIKGKGGGLLDGVDIDALHLVGQFGFSRDIAVLTYEGSQWGRHISAFFVLSERGVGSVSPADPRLRPYALLASHAQASAIGLVPTRPASGEVVSLQFHGASAGVSAAISGATAAFQSSDFLGFNVPGTFSGPLQAQLSSPRVCLYPTAGGELAMMVICESGGLGAQDGCPVDRLCDAPVGLAVGIEAQTDSLDFDLDGRGSKDVQSSTPCASTKGDLCPCAIIPAGDCP